MKLYHDPLLHFAVAGALLFAGYTLINRGETDTSPTDPVRVGEGEVLWLKETFANQWQRQPTGEELGGLVAGLLEEELLAREAKTLGLDQNDTIVRRRLAQKLAFLVDDTSRVAEPNEEDLRQFYATNAERFRVEPRLSFTQIFFNPTRRQHAETDAKAALVLISTADGNRSRDHDRRSDLARDRVPRRRSSNHLEPVRRGLRAYGVHAEAGIVGRSGEIRLRRASCAGNRSAAGDAAPIRGGSTEGPAGVAARAREANEGTVSEKIAREVRRRHRRSHQPAAVRITT